MPFAMYAFVQLIWTPQADVGSEKLRWKESDEARGTYEKKKKKQITRSDGLMRGIFVIPIRDGHFGTPAG